MNFLLDTNVVSEIVKPRPNAALLQWLAEVDEDRTFLSVVTLMELRYGVERLAAGGKRKRLEEWLDDELVARFADRALSVDAPIANACGRLLARSESVGHPMDARDALIAATAEVKELTLVTRNVSDFTSVMKNLISPWRQ